ncbi:unnamed protein product [Effrenium voratum]|uniref:Farnesoic acid O-methyl transferase domain-containing protein n=1 Tax=Effrenium voratum TaxID=2562239 RepID=A0AA36IG62_9DINO|nr:unnamed protein product [Effrenium voratum]CAJ1420705.1 unnamed protein product [Effrenium voratum]
MGRRQTGVPYLRSAPGDQWSWRLHLQSSWTQGVSFLVSVKAPRDIFLFLGQKGQIGYEILLGAFENTRITLSRGYVREAQYDNFGPPTAVVSYATADRAPILDPMAFRTFWVDADPLTHVIRVGAQEIFGHNVLIEYTDNNFLQNLNTVLLGAGYWSAGGSNRDVLPEAYVCPRPGNLLLGRFIQSSSVAFNGSPDKAVDGQWGSNTFCEYCAHKDPLHVCASTRRQDIYNPPFFRIAMGEVFYFIQSVRLVVPTDGRPEQSADWSIHVGEAGFRSDSLCTVIADARGDNVWPCNPDINTLGKFVSVWGSVHQLKVLPEEFGIRICEIEAYAREQTTRLLDIQNKFELAQGLPASFPDGSSQSIQIEGLQPNKSYEVFCYGEDMYGNQQYSTTDPITFVTTEDTTAPKLRINHIYPDDLSITVEVGLDDPGNAYPALARCMATTQEGKAPQEHEVYFEHRFWRIRFNTQYTDLEPACADRVLLRVLQLQSWAGETFQKFSWSSDPGAPPETIGLDTDGDRLIDSFEIAQWSLPAQDAWVGIDLLHQPETVSRMRSRGFLLQGDLAVAIRWEGNVDDLDLSVIGPGSMYDDLNLTEAEIRVTDFGSYVVACYPGDGCTTPVLGAQFVLATPGRYNVAVYRRGMNTAADLQISAHVRLCGEELEYHLTLAAEDQNDTIVSGLRVPFTGCHRQLRSKVDNLRNWQSSVFDGGNSEATMWYMADTDETTCMETGGMDLSSDPKPWWRMSLERTQLLQGIWLAGLPGSGVAEMADIFVSPSTTSDVSAVVDLDSYNGQRFSTSTTRPRAIATE